MMLMSAVWWAQDPGEAERAGAAKPGSDVSGIVELRGVKGEANSNAELLNAHMAGSHGTFDQRHI